MNAKSQNIILIPILIMSFALAQNGQALNPPPDGGYSGGNTAEGQNALFSLTSGGYNAAVGWLSLRSDTTGSFNTAIGAGALLANTANENTATGAGALLSNSSGANNTANGAFALFSNTLGHDNTATGTSALQNNNNGNFNTATGESALFFNTTGTLNTAVGSFALLFNNTGSENNALGYAALSSNTGDGNTAIGDVAGSDLTTGSGNVCIGKDVRGVAGESDTTRIRNIGSTAQDTGIYVTLDVVGGDKLGYVAIPSSRRYKDEIKPMDKTSEALFALKPVNFRYKREINPDGAQRFGLIAEEVEKINPALVSYDLEGKPVTVRYESINAMLLNEFLKEHQKVEEQEATIMQLKSDATKQEATISQLNKRMEVFATTLKEQAAQIQKVNAQLEGNRPPLQTVLNNH